MVILEISYCNGPFMNKALNGTYLFIIYMYVFTMELFVWKLNANESLRFWIYVWPLTITKASSRADIFWI